MRRRRILELIAAAPALCAGRLYAAPTSSPRFLLVFLRGGYDCLNAVVPYSSADYYAARPTIAVPRPAARPEPSAPLDLDSAFELDADWALAPAHLPTVLTLGAFAGLAVLGAWAALLSVRGGAPKKI